MPRAASNTRSWRKLSKQHYASSQTALKGKYSKEAKKNSSAAAIGEPIGSFWLWEAKLILKRFARQGIRFKISSDDSWLRNMGVIVTSMGGYFGAGSLINIYVHRDDEIRAREILDEIYKQ
jgi:hypothetical protein